MCLFVFLLHRGNFRGGTTATSGLETGVFCQQLFFPSDLKDFYIRI